MKAYKIYILLSLLIWSWAFCQEQQIDKTKLQSRVDDILKQDDVSLRKDINDVFLLADIYKEDGNDKKAFELYEKALKVDGWRLDYQMKLANLLIKFGEPNEAALKAKTVYKYAEDESLIRNAEALLTSQGIKISAAPVTNQANTAASLEIVIIPIGKLNKILTYELQQQLQEIIGIKYTVSDNNLSPGQMDRPYAHNYADKVFRSVKKNLGVHDMNDIMAEMNLTQKDLETSEGKIKFLKDFFSKVSLDDFNRFNQNIESYKNKGQYDASRLLSELRSKYDWKNMGNSCIGCLGITDVDIYSDDCNFLFGSGGKNTAVMSYHRFTSAFNEEPPNRPRLLKRSIKQAISSTFHILGIPRCSNPDCARAYPNDLAEHDQKSIEICPPCKKQLQSFINSKK